jgi:CBS domain-containing protein
MPNRIVRDIIAGRPPLLATENRSVAGAIALMLSKNGGSAVLVTPDGKPDELVGMFTEHDLMTRVVQQQRDPATTPLAAVMTPNPQTIDLNQRFGHAMHLMHLNGYRHIPVVENGRPMGTVSLRDVLTSEQLAFEEELHYLEKIGEAL